MWQTPLFLIIFKFGSFKNPSAAITNLSKLYFRFRRFFMLVQTKKPWKPWRKTENHGDEWYIFLIITMRNLYISSYLNLITKFTSSSRSIEFKDFLPYNISQIITKTIPVSRRIFIKCAMKRGITFWVWQKVTMIKISKWRESHCRTNASVRRYS